MEAAGLAVGVVALVSVFSECVQFFSTFYTADRDLDLLDTKLDVEKTLFLQWAARVRLLQPNYDPRLDDRDDTHQAVRKVLFQMRSLFQDATKIENRYGLIPSPHTYNETEAQAAESKYISWRRLGHFDMSLEKLTKRVGNLNISPVRRARWAVKDKSSFDELLVHISYLVDKLHKLVPDAPDGQATRIMVEEDFCKDLRTRRLKLVCRASAGRADIVEAATRSLVAKCKERIHNLLWYREMDMRERKISPAHETTFQWVLQPQPKDSEWDDLSQWLESETGIYWVRGKAGSGKSTLMKYIWFHPRTRRLVSRWAGGSPFLMANFYFWRIGTDNQCSLEGLFRGIVCQILQHCPSATQTLFPDLWEKAIVYDDDEAQAPLAIPSLDELKAVSLRFNQVTELRNTKVCLFIDGLDEFKGDYRDGIDFFSALTVRPEIKVVISSRPEPVLVDTLGGFPSLRLESLTKEDIRVYARDKLGEHPYIQKLVRLGSISESEELISDITQKACGVFLWVVLACRSLLDGFAACDRMPELRKRIDDLPPELENLFIFMLQKVDPRYRVQGARILNMCYLNSASPWAYPVPTLGLAMLDEDGMDPSKMSSKQQWLSVEQMADRCSILEGRLRSRCGGLLEVALGPKANVTRKSKKTDRLEEGGCFCTGALSRLEHDCFVDSTVEFMHKTVFEFLHDESTWKMECLGLGDQSFSPEAAIACVFLHAARLGKAYPRQVRRYLKECITYATLAPKHAEYSVEVLLQRLDEFVSVVADGSGVSSTIGDFVLRVAVEAGMEPFVRRYIQHRPSSLQTPKSSSLFPLLHHATYKCILRPLLDNGTVRWSNPEHVMRYSLSKLPSPAGMVHLLLSMGADPNELFLSEDCEMEYGAWLALTLSTMRHASSTTPLLEAIHQISSSMQPLQHLEIIEQYIRHGHFEYYDEIMARIKRLKEEIPSKTWEPEERRNVGILAERILRYGRQSADHEGSPPNHFIDQERRSLARERVQKRGRTDDRDWNPRPRRRERTFSRRSSTFTFEQGGFQHVRANQWRR